MNGCSIRSLSNSATVLVWLLRSNASKKGAASPEVEPDLLLELLASALDETLDFSQLLEKLSTQEGLLDAVLGSPGDAKERDNADIDQLPDDVE